MGALIPIIIAAIPDAIQLEQFIQRLIQQQSTLQQANRPDVDDATLIALGQLIDGLQAHINQQAALRP